MWLAGYWPADHLDVLIMRCAPNSALVDRVDFATPPFAVLSIGFQPLGACPRPAGWRGATLCFVPTAQWHDVRCLVVIRVAVYDICLMVVPRNFVQIDAVGTVAS